MYISYPYISYVACTMMPIHNDACVYSPNKHDSIFYSDRHLIGQIEVTPPSRTFQRELQEMRVRQDKRDPGPCGGFCLSYRYMCDYYGLPYMPDVAWVSTINKGRGKNTIKFNTWQKCIDQNINMEKRKAWVINIAKEIQRRLKINLATTLEH